MNVMPTSVAKKINAQIQKSGIKILQLDRTHVQVTGELKNVQIRLVSNPNVWQTIDIIVIDISEAYGLLLSKDWSMKIEWVFCNKLVSFMVTTQRGGKSNPDRQRTIYEIHRHRFRSPESTFGVSQGVT